MVDGWLCHAGGLGDSSLLHKRDLFVVEWGTCLQCVVIARFERSLNL